VVILRPTPVSGKSFLTEFTESTELEKILVVTQDYFMKPFLKPAVWHGFNSEPFC